MKQYKQIFKFLVKIDDFVNFDELNCENIRWELFCNIFLKTEKIYRILTYS